MNCPECGNRDASVYDGSLFHCPGCHTERIVPDPNKHCPLCGLALKTTNSVYDDAGFRTARRACSSTVGCKYSHVTASFVVSQRGLPGRPNGAGYRNVANAIKAGRLRLEGEA